MEWFDGVFSAALSASACLINFLMLSKIVRPEYVRQDHEGFLEVSKLNSLISGKRSQNHYSVNNKLMLLLWEFVCLQEKTSEKSQFAFSAFSFATIALDTGRKCILMELLFENNILFVKRRELLKGKIPLLTLWWTLCLPNNLAFFRRQGALKIFIYFNCFSCIVRIWPKVSTMEAPHMCLTTI